jgi:hypothetical protein
MNRRRNTAYSSLNLNVAYKKVIAKEAQNSSRKVLKTADNLRYKSLITVLGSRFSLIQGKENGEEKSKSCKVSEEVL